MRILLLSFWYLFSLVSVAQYTVKDKTTKEPISFARYEYASFGGHTDLRGMIKLNMNFNDTLRIYALGYDKLILSKEEVEFSKTLYMISSKNQLDTIKLVRNRPKLILSPGEQTKIIGFSSFPTTNNSFLTRLVPSDTLKSYRINNIKLFFTTLKSESRYARKEDKQFALKISILNNDFQPLHESIFLSKTRKLENTIDFDVSDAHVFIEDEPLFVNIENLGDLNDDGSFNGFERGIRIELTEKVFSEFVFLATDSVLSRELWPLTKIFNNAYKDGDIKYPTGLPPTEVYNLNPKMEFTVTEY
jgi:hypothetical protein